MPAFVAPWIDGEKIPDERLREIFRPPPGVPKAFYRSSLVIGSRGSGKTTLFRYQQSIHQGVALYISLPTEFSILTKQTGYGPLAVDCPPNLEPLVIGKATSLLALTLIEAFVRNVGPIPGNLLQEYIPAAFHSLLDGMDLDRLSSVRSALTAAPLEQFEDLCRRRLRNLVAELGGISNRNRGPLLLLLDRADMVFSPALVPVFDLLDQSRQFITLVAMRPAPVSNSIAMSSDGAVAGDHYGLVHLGIQPYSDEWQGFVTQAVEAQLGSAFASVPAEVKGWVMAIARDSLRVVLELFARYVTDETEPPLKVLLRAMEELRQNQLAAAQQTLQSYHPDYRRFVADVRADVVGQHQAVSGPVVVSLDASPFQQTFFAGRSNLRKFVDAALRSGALCLPENYRWVPCMESNEIEIPPLLIWQESDPQWTGATRKPVTVLRKEAQLLAPKGGPPQAPSVFVAYRMGFKESREFRQTIQEKISAYPGLHDVTVLDGHVPVGVLWPKKIRERIIQAKAVIGDVTGMRPDVIFELGFAHGLRKITIPAVATPEAKASIPRWLTAAQIGHFGNLAGYTGLMSDLASRLASPDPAPIKQPVPSLAVWLHNPIGDHSLVDQFRRIASQEGLKAQVLEPDEAAISRAMTASLLIAPLNGTDVDTLIHYVCGGIVARPKAGFGRKLQRQILLIEPLGQQVVADSLRRCTSIVKVIEPSQILKELKAFGESHREWAKSGEGRRTDG